MQASGFYHNKIFNLMAIQDRYFNVVNEIHEML
jgi:hypothetical protein